MLITISSIPIKRKPANDINIFNINMYIRFEKSEEEEEKKNNKNFNTNKWHEEDE